MNRVVFVFIFAFPIFAKTICLNMIVKNESDCILTCLDSVKDWIDYWVIVDTGSTDGTQNKIIEAMKGIPGELHERPWVNFGHNRNEALEIAKSKADYTLLIDADEELIFEKDASFPSLEKDCYFICVREPVEIDYHRVCLVNNKLRWKWIGKIHETIACDDPCSAAVLKQVINYSDTTRGNRSKDPDKYVKDAKILEQELLEDPANGRNVFFLAQCYHCARKQHLALKYFKKRASMGGWEEEIFYSKYMIGCIEERLNRPGFVQSYKDAFAYRPSRVEPLFQLGKHYIRSENYEEAYAVLKQAIAIPESLDGIYVERWIYEWGALYYFGECCAQLNKIDELDQTLKRLALCKNLPLEKRRKVEEILSNASSLKASCSD